MSSPQDKVIAPRKSSPATYCIRENAFVVILREKVVFPKIQTRIRLTQRTHKLFHEHCERHKTVHAAIITLKPGSTMDACQIGTFCNVIDHSPTIFAVEGRSRFKIVRWLPNFDLTQACRIATVELIDCEEEVENDSVQVQALMNSVLHSITKHLREYLSHEGNQERDVTLLSELYQVWRQSGPETSAKSASLLADIVGAGLGELTTAERQQVLTTVPVQKRLELVLNLLFKARVGMQISEQRESRKAALQRQMQEIQKELRKLKQNKKSSSKL